MTNGANIGTQGFIWAVLSTEILAVLFDLRWMLFLVVVFVLTDFWWGSKETMQRYKETGDNKYKWRFSRAGRRTLNKFVDFLTYLLIGTTIGMAILEPLGVCSHTVSGAVALALGGLFDVSSIIGHVCYLHGIDTKGGILKIAWRIIVALAKRKSNDLGTVLEQETIKDNDNEQKD